jgi:hypothetical protein
MMRTAGGPLAPLHTVSAHLSLTRLLAAILELTQGDPALLAAVGDSLD